MFGHVDKSCFQIMVKKKQKKKLNFFLHFVTFGCAKITLIIGLLYSETKSHTDSTKKVQILFSLSPALMVMLDHY